MAIKSKLTHPNKEQPFPTVRNPTEKDDSAPRAQDVTSLAVNKTSQKKKRNTATAAKNQQQS